MAQPRLGIEILKLLVQVAWADHEVSPEEIETVLSLAETVKASQEEVDYLRKCLSEETRLPAPDFALLREHSDAVLAAVDQMIAADSEVCADEMEVRAH